MKLDVYLHFNQDFLDVLKNIEERIIYMSEAMDTLIGKVTAMETVVDGMIELMTTIKSELDEAIANNDIQQIIALSERIGADTEKYAAAVAANTPTA